ncbi:hypothetical protein LSTR_LSTR013778, partial [Laodelphax striatellus]
MSDFEHRLRRRGDEAIAVLTQDEKSELLDAGLLYERCLLLCDRVEHRSELFVITQLLFSRHFAQIRTHEELRALSTFNRISKRRAALKDIRVASGGQVEDIRPSFIDGSRVPTAEQEWQLFTKLVNVCFQEKRFALLQRLVFSAQGSERFAVFAKQLDIYCLIASFHNRDSNLAYNFIRNMVIKDADCVRLWNFFNIHVIRGDHCRHNKFIMRLLTRRQNHTILSLLHANNCLVSGTYKYALNEYMATFKREPEPMLAFLIGVTLCQMACQKFSAKKHSLVTQPNGRFQTQKKICLSISGHHPETWQPSWSIRTALLALIAFMPTPGNGTIGSLDYTPHERKQLARKSQVWECDVCGKMADQLDRSTDNSNTPITSDESNLINNVIFK